MVSHQNPTPPSSHYNHTVGDELLGFEAQGGGSNSTNVLPIPTYYSSLYRAIAVTLSSVIFTVGFVGNVLVVVVIARTKSMHTTTNCYLLSLAVADCLVLLAATLPAVPETFFQVDEWPFGRALCSILIYAQYAGIDASSLSIGAFTVERYIAICHPIRAQTMCTVSRAKRIILVLWVFTVVYCGPWLWLTDLRVVSLADGSTIRRCEFRLARASYLTLYMIDLILFYLLPFVISAVLYCLIGRILLITSLRHACDRHKRANTDRTRPFDKARPLDNVSKRRSDSRVQVIRMLVVVVVVFATLWMPYRVMVVYNSFAEHKYLNLWFLMFSRTLIYINCAINPILYNVLSVKFRRAFRNHLCCGLRPAGPPQFFYSEMGTDTNTRRHAPSHQRAGLSPQKNDMTPCVCRTNLPSSHQQSEQIEGRGHSDHHQLKVILLEWVKGSDRVKLRLSDQRCYGTDDKGQTSAEREEKNRGLQPAAGRISRTSADQNAIQAATELTHAWCLVHAESNQTIKPEPVSVAEYDPEMAEEY